MQVYKGASSSGNISKEFTMNAAFIDADGIITNIIVVDSIEGHPELDLHPVNPWVGIGMHIDEPEPVTNPVDVPTPTPPKKTSCSSLEFIEKFTDAEQLAIVTASMSSPQVKLWYDKLIAATQIVFSDPRLAAGMDALVAAGLITEARSLEVLPADVRTTNVTTI